MKFHVGTNRRRFLRMLTAAGTVSALPLPGRADPAEPPLAWRVGAGASEITPPLEVGLLMSSGRQLWEPFDGVRLPIYARAVVVEGADGRVALVALDLLGLAAEAVGGMGPLKQQVVEASGQAVQADELILASTHTHSSPESAALTDLFKTESYQGWRLRGWALPTNSEVGWVEERDPRIRSSPMSSARGSRASTHPTLLLIC